MTTDYKTVFQLAQDKGYKIIHKRVFSTHYSEDEIMLNVLLELTLIQKWLRDEHKIVATSFPIAKDRYGFSIDFIEAMSDEYSNDADFCVDQILHNDKKNYSFPDIDTMKGNKWNYESALLEGIAAALLLI